MAGLLKGGVVIVICTISVDVIVLVEDAIEVITLVMLITLGTVEVSVNMVAGAPVSLPATPGTVTV